MVNEHNGQVAQAMEKPAGQIEKTEEAKPAGEKKPGYPMRKRKYTPIYTIIVFLYGILVKLLFFM